MLEIFSAIGGIVGGILLPIMFFVFNRTNKKKDEQIDELNKLKEKGSSSELRLVEQSIIGEIKQMRIEFGHEKERVSIIERRIQTIAEDHSTFRAKEFYPFRDNFNNYKHEIALMNQEFMSKLDSTVKDISNRFENVEKAIANYISMHDKLCPFRTEKDEN